MTDRMLANPETSPLVRHARRIPRGLRKVPAIALASMVLAIATTSPASAQSLGGGGNIGANANCNLRTRTATVSVTVMNPSQFASSGLVYYTELWAKASTASRWVFIKGGQSPTIKTHRYVTNELGFTYLTNNPTTVFSGSFTGANSNYDILIQYWYRTPNSSIWAGPYSFVVANDPHSSTTITTNTGYGNLTSPSSVCYL